jgi:hypothetical protein
MIKIGLCGINKMGSEIAKRLIECKQELTVIKLIDEIIEILSSDSGKLSHALIKTKVLLHKICHKELVPWVDNELKGYPDRDSIKVADLIVDTMMLEMKNESNLLSTFSISSSLKGMTLMLEEGKKMGMICTF